MYYIIKRVDHWNDDWNNKKNKIKSKSNKSRLRELNNHLRTIKEIDINNDTYIHLNLEDELIKIK